MGGNYLVLLKGRMLERPDLPKHIVWVCWKCLSLQDLWPKFNRGVVGRRLGALAGPFCTRALCRTIFSIWLPVAAHLNLLLLTRAFSIQITNACSSLYFESFHPASVKHTGRCHWTAAMWNYEIQELCHTSHKSSSLPSWFLTMLKLFHWFTPALILLLTSVVPSILLAFLGPPVNF